MFDFLFKKKATTYSIDFSNLKVDIHSHLLPGIDDGAKDIDNSLDLIVGLQDLGFSKFITTPHVYQEFYPNTSRSIQIAMAQVHGALREENNTVSISCSAEYFLDDFFEEKVRNNDILAFGDHYVLVEMSFFAKPKKFNHYIFDLMTRGYRPILAHPERHLFLGTDPKVFAEIKERGCKLQLNLLSLTGHYGPEVKKIAEILLKAELYDFAGTDCHNLGHIEKLKELLPGAGKTELTGIFKNAQTFA